MAFSAMATRRFVLLFVVCAGLCVAGDPETFEQSSGDEQTIPSRPHIVMFIADDLGWSDVSFHGSKQVPTPNIDALARDGIILNQYYVQPVCSPSRGSLMTGDYPIRFGFQHEVIAIDQAWGLPLGFKIMPQYFKSLDYSTYAVGKWHLGFFKDEYLPINRGFDNYFGYYSGGEDYWTHVAVKGNYSGLDLHCNSKNVWRYNGTYGTELFSKKAKEVILHHNPDTPMFLYLAQQGVHSGNFQGETIQAPKYYYEPLVGINDKKRRKFGGMIRALDVSIGDIFEALDESGMLDKTLFLFTTDNGGAGMDQQDKTKGSNFPLKGSKYTLWEGGTRGVAFVWAPFLRKGRIHNQLMHISDWLPTLLSAAGGPEAVQMLGEIDGFDQWPSLIHNSPSPRNKLLYNYDEVTNIKALRRGCFKYVNGSFGDGEYDIWYDVNSRPIRNGLVPPLSPEKKVLYEQTYMKLLKQSKCPQILKRKYNRNPELTAYCQTIKCKKQLEIQCGPRPLENTCNAQAGPCLFDVEEDPCEFYNLAEILPNVLIELERETEEYRPFIVSSSYHPSDPRSNPDLHGGAWVPWL